MCKYLYIIISIEIQDLNHVNETLISVWHYRISGIFRVGLIFAEFAISIDLPKLDTAKN